MSGNGIYSKVFHPLYQTFNTYFPSDHQIDADEAFTRIEQEALYLDQMDRKPMWNGFSREAVSSITLSVKKAVAQFEKEGVQDKTALDLGCGKSASPLIFT